MDTDKYPTAEFSRRLAGVYSSAYWSPSRPPGPGWQAGPDYPEGTLSFQDASDRYLDLIDERDKLIEGCTIYENYDDLPDDLKKLVATIEKYNAWHAQLEQRSADHANEELHFHPVGQIPLTAAEKQAATKAIRMAKADGKADIAKWFEDSIDTNPNAVRSVLAEMGLDDDE